MTATLESFEDPQIEALLALLVPGLLANLPVDDGAPIVAKAFGWPVARRFVTGGELPLLLVYRRTDETFYRTTQKEHRCVFVFEYVHPEIPPSHAASRWPILRKVWAEVERLVSAGHDPAYADDRTVLKAAGFTGIDRSQPARVTYAGAANEGENRPSWLATMTLTHRDEFDRSTLQDFLSLDVQYRLVGGDDALVDGDPVSVEDHDPDQGEQPLVRELLTP